VTLRGVGLVRLVVFPVLAVSVSIGAVMPSAPFDAWSPPPVSVQRGARPVTRTVHGERGLTIEGPRATAPTLSEARPPLATFGAVLGTPTPLLAATDGACPQPCLHGPSPPPAWSLARWAGTAAGPDRAPPLLPTA